MKTPEQFMEYFRANYPGPNTIISKPDWHAPKIYAAAIAASGHAELLEALKEASVYVYGAYECAFPDNDINNQVLAQIDAAIAKATGESQ